ncbi:hypothetical protein TKK_0000353 [Trichogramma kaykai]|uniref:Nuclear pore complex protein Nup88 n=1 Tax=Trichogramma kaykai TaxID=54128 RepID=A0ABD2W7W0_9HYME
MALMAKSQRSFSPPSPTKLQPTDPPIFEVSQLLINETATQLVLWGELGIVVVELPKRWGKDASFQGGKSVVSCLSYNLDGCTSQLSTSEVRKVRWHPGSTSDSHLVVLTSDNIFLLYECELGGAGPKLVRTWKVGPSMHSPASKVPSFAALGDTAVDFDFATPSLRQDGGSNASVVNVDKANWKQIEWPILVLRGSGDVLIVRGNVLLNQNKPVVFGSLSMYPPAVDNYGIDSCSIMCLQTTPPIVAIASCSGKIYHAIMLDERINEEDDAGIVVTGRDGGGDDGVDHETTGNKLRTWSQYGSTYSLHTPDEALYVYECIEMELGLCYSADDASLYSCQINLHADRERRNRYFCSHNAGMHLVEVPMVDQLDEYVAAANDLNAELHLPNLQRASSSQYLLSTRTKYTSSDEATPVLGFGLLQEPCMLLALLHTGVVVDISVVDSFYIPRVESSAPTVSPSKRVTKEPFDVYVKRILKHETSQPITMIGIRQNLTIPECFDLLYRATTVFRKQHFAHHDRVREEFNKKLRTLKALKNHQIVELESLAEMKKYLQEKAENLAERYEDVKDKQEELARRAEQVLRLVHLKEPTMSPVERAECEEIKKMSKDVKDLGVRLEQLKKKKAVNQNLISDTGKRMCKTEIVLKPTQVETVKSNLTQMGKDIAELIARAKTLQEQLNV